MTGGYCFCGQTAGLRKIGGANRRPADRFSVGRQFGCASCALAFLSAAFAHLYR
jgi:hypothetical protein